MTNDNPYRLAAGMAARDFPLILLLYPILLIPVAVEQWLLPVSLGELVVALIVDRTCELIVLAIIGTRWIGRLRPEGPRPRLISLLPRLFVAGFLVWSAIVLPVLLGLKADAEWSFLIGLCLLAPGSAFAFRHLFYFIPILIGVRSLREIFYEARQITAEDRLMPFRVLVGPFALMLLFVTLSIAPVPDGRSIFFSTLSSSFTGIFWILSTYLGLAFGFRGISLSRWRAQRMDHYRDERFDTISLKAPNALAKLMTARVGFRILAVALFFMLGNYTRSATIPPSPHIAMNSVAVDGSKVRVELTLSDPRYKFRAFSPSNFMLAGESGIPISKEIPHVKVDGKSVEGAAVPRGVDQFGLTLDFETNRSDSDLRELEDLWLWYQFVKLFPIPKNMLAGSNKEGADFDSPAPDMIQLPPSTGLEVGYVIP